jgi:hypothetical protein
MAIPSKHRWIFYIVALLFTVAAVHFAGGDDRAVTAVVAPAAERPERPQARVETDGIPELDLDKLEPRAHKKPDGDPFGAKSWDEMARAEARRNAPPPTPPKPQAPPLAFAYMGKLIDDEQTILFLTKESRNYILRQGDVIDGIYRVDEIGEHAVSFTYLPLKVKQTLAFGGEN